MRWCEKKIKNSKLWDVELLGKKKKKKKKALDKNYRNYSHTDYVIALWNEKSILYKRVVNKEEYWFTAPTKVDSFLFIYFSSNDTESVYHSVTT